MGKWQDQNRFYLNWRIQKVRDALNLSADSEYKADAAETFCDKPEKDFSIDTLSKVFGLTRFEQDVLIMCAAMETEGDFPVLCAKIQGDPAKTYPTFAIALSCLHKPHWSAVLADSPLRKWNLISVIKSEILSHSPIFIDESVLHFILGISQTDAKLAQISEPVFLESHTTEFNQNTAEKIADTVKKGIENTKKACPVHLFGNDFEDIRAIAAKACCTLELKLYAMPVSFIPDDPGKLDLIIKLWSRESCLNNTALIIECRDDLISIEPKTRAALCLMLQKVKGTVFIATFDSKPADLCLCISFEVKIRLWGDSKKNSGAQLADLAQQIETKATWDDLILPESQIELIRAVAGHVRYRAKVYESWGFASKYSRGMGITAVFAGLSGTGKTMAAEVLANELDLKLYKIELSSVVSKYIGDQVLPIFL